MSFFRDHCTYSQMNRSRSSSLSASKNPALDDQESSAPSMAEPTPLLRNVEPSLMSSLLLPTAAMNRSRSRSPSMSPTAIPVA